MAMSGSRLGSAMTSNVQAIPGITITNATELQNFLTALADAIVSEIQNNADVLPAGHSSSLQNPSGQAISVTAGPGSGSTGATSAAETIVGTGAVQ